MSIKIEHRNLETRKTLDDFFIQERNFLLPLSLKVFRHKERGTIFLYRLFHLPFPPTRVAPATKVSASKRKPTVFPEAGLISTHWLFQNLPKSSARFRCVTSFVLASLRFPSRAIVTSLSDTFALRARAWTPVLMLHLTNHVLSRKVLSLTKPKGKNRNPSAIILHCGIVVSEFVLCRNNVHFGQIPLGEVWTPLSSQLWVK